MPDRGSARCFRCSLCMLPLSTSLLHLLSSQIKSHASGICFLLLIKFSNVRDELFFLFLTLIFYYYFFGICALCAVNWAAIKRFVEILHALTTRMCVRDRWGGLSRRGEGSVRIMNLVWKWRACRVAYVTRARLSQRMMDVHNKRKIEIDDWKE